MIPVETSEFPLTMIGGDGDGISDTRGGGASGAIVEVADRKLEAVSRVRRAARLPQWESTPGRRRTMNVANSPRSPSSFPSSGAALTSC